MGTQLSPRECGECKKCEYGTFAVKGGCRPEVPLILYVKIGRYVIKD